MPIADAAHVRLELRALPIAGLRTAVGKGGTPRSPVRERLAAKFERIRGTDSVQVPVDLAVDAAEEERRDAVDSREVSGARLQTGEVRVDDLLVALESEQQRNVDVASLGDQLLHSGYALRCGGDLHHQVRLGNPLVQRPRRSDRSLRVVRNVRGDLDRDEAVIAATRGVDRVKLREGILDISEDHFPVDVRWSCSVCDERADLILVVVRARDRLGEDGRVRGDATDTVGD